MIFNSTFLGILFPTPAITGHKPKLVERFQIIVYSKIDSCCHCERFSAKQSLVHPLEIILAKSASQ